MRQRFNALLTVGATAVMATQVSAAFVAYNDTGGENTPPNANTTRYGQQPQGTKTTTVAASSLKDITSGSSLTATVEIAYTTNANGYQNGSTAFDSGSPAANLFNSYVTFNSGSAESIEVDSASNLTYTFASLDGTGAQKYSFAGSAIRGDASYTNRWTKVTISGADSFTHASTSATNVVVGTGSNGLSTNEVAFNSGYNTIGSVIRFDNIMPGSDGKFSIISTQYTGGSGAGGSKGYALAGFRLEESAVPEPTSLSLIGLGAAALLGRRRRAIA